MEGSHVNHSNDLWIFVDKNFALFLANIWRKIYKSFPLRVTPGVFVTQNRV